MSIADLQTAQQPYEVQLLKANMLKVQEELVTKTPGLQSALVTIHKILMEHEELVHLLDDDDIAHLHQAHELHKQVALVQKEAKKSKSNGRKKLNDNDLNNL